MSASLGDLVVSLAGDIAKFEEAMTKAEYLADQTSKRIDASMKSAERAVIGLAAGYASFKTIEAFKDNIEGAIEAAASLQKVALQSGTTAEELSKLKGVAKLSGTDISVVATTLQSVSKAMLETAQGTGKAKLSIEGLKLSVKDESGHLKDNIAFLTEVAKKLDGMTNSTERNAIAQKLLKGTGAEAIPFLLDLAKSGELNALVTNKQAAEAEEYEKTLRKLDFTNKAFYNTVAQQVTPVLTAMIETIIEVKTQTGGLNDTAKKLAVKNEIRDWAVDAGIGFGMVVNAVRTVVAAIDIIAKAVGAMVADSVTFLGVLWDSIKRSIEAFKAFGDVALGVQYIMSGRMLEGAELVKAGLNGIGDAATGFGLDIKKAMYEAQAHSEGFANDLDRITDDFEKNNFADKFIAKTAAMGKQVEETRKATETHFGIIKKVALDAVDAMEAALGKHIAKLQEEIDYMREYGMETKSTAVAVAAFELKQQEATGVLAEHARKTGESVEAIKKRVLALAALDDTLTKVHEQEKYHIEALKQEHDAVWNAFQAAVDLEKSLTDQIATYGMTTQQVTEYTIAQLESKKVLAGLSAENADIVRGLQNQIDKLRQVAALQGSFDGLKNMMSVVMQVTDQVGNLAQAWLDRGVAGAIAYAHNELKKLMADIVILMAKKIVLNIIANAAGGSLGASITAQAASLGGNTLAGSVVSAAGSWLGMGASTALPAAAQGFGPTAVGAASGLGSLGTAAAGSSGTSALTTTIITTLAKIPLWGWIGAAIVAGMAASNSVYNRGYTQANTGTGGFVQSTSPELLADRLLQGLGMSGRIAGILTGSPIIARILAAMGIGGENWRAQVGFGSNAQAYRTQGVFGAEGFHNIAGSDSLNRVLQDFMASTSTIDAVIARTLTASQISTISTNLQNAPMREFAFSNRDQSAGQQLTLEYLQQKYGTIFDQIDSTFAAFIRGYTGKSTDLAQEIAKFVDFMDSLSSVGIKGLNIQALRSWQQSGEDIGATLTRVTTDYGNFLNAFTSESMKLKTAQDFVVSVFADLHIAIPASVDGFRELVQSIDVSTEAGRNMFTTLMQVAPAFQQVTAAAAAMEQSFHQTMAAIYGSSYSSAALRAQAIDLIRQFQSMTGVTAGTDPAQVLASIGTVTSDTMDQLFGMLDGPGKALLTQILGIYSQLNQVSSSGNSPLSYATSGVNNFSAGLTNLGDQLAGARQSLKDWLAGLFTNDTLSPLSPVEKLTYARSQYETMLSLAQGGNADAIQGLQGSAQTYLQLARGQMASGPEYNNVIRSVYDQVAQIAGPGTPSFNTAFQAALPEGRLASQADMVDVKVLLAAILQKYDDGLTVSDPVLHQKNEELARLLARMGYSDGVLLQR